jgi:radical SAM superfamily enzyme YgiQ (UPF0313 family)
MSRSVPLRVLFISCDSNMSFPTEPLGIESILGHLNVASSDTLNVKLLDAQFTSLKVLEKELRAFSPHVVGISTRSSSLKDLYAFKNLLSKQKLEPLIVIGGTLASFVYDEILDVFPKGLVVRGEGEDSFLQILKYYRGEIKLSEISNLVYKNKQDIIMNLQKVPNLELLGLPERKFAKRIYHKRGSITIEASRGCNNSCSYCSARLIHAGCGLRLFPISRIIEDLKVLLKLGIKTVSFADEDFFGSPDKFRYIEFAEEIKKLKLKFSFNISTRSESIVKIANSKYQKQSLLELYKKIGLNLVFLGVESGCDSQLKRYAKGTTVKTNIKAMNFLSKFKLNYSLGLILMEPLSNLNELKQNISFLELHKIWNYSNNPFGALRIYRGTPYMKLAQKQGVLVGNTGDFQMNYVFLNSEMGLIAEILDSSYNLIKKELRIIKHFEWSGKTDEVPANILRKLKNLRAKGVKLSISFAKNLTSAYEKNDLENVEKIKKRYFGKFMFFKNKLQDEIFNLQL